MRVVIATLIAVGLGLNLSACGDSEKKDSSKDTDSGTNQTQQEDGGTGGGGSDAATNGGDDAGADADAATSDSDPGSDAGTGNFAFIEGATACDELPGSLADTEPGEYKGACLAVDWTNNPCTVMETDCPNGLFFDWQDKEGGYFNLKVWSDDIVSSTAGTVNQKPTGVSGSPSSVTGLPEGENVMVQILTEDNVRYNIEFRRDGNVITINYIIKLAF